jgi:hypothetical protein
MIRNAIRRVVLIASAAMVFAAFAAGPTAAHTKVITPPVHDEPVVSGPISRAWAQAHCNAASPEIVTDQSNGVVRFAPGIALPCPAVPNPGGQIHGD